MNKQDFSRNLAFVKIIDGELHRFLKDISIYGRIDDGEFVIYGCQVENESKFYQGIYEYDKVVDVHGFESADDVKDFWESGGDGTLLHIDKDCWDIVE